MATLVLGGIGQTLGGPIGGFIGAMAGTWLDSQFMGMPGTTYHSGLQDKVLFPKQGYGHTIPILYGTCRLMGTLLWAMPIREQRIETRGSGKQGRKHKTVHYEYYLTCALALCEGVIEAIHRVWVNGQPMPLEHCHYRWYSGDETQQPDPLIESIEGMGKTPAYRGLAYVVIEDLPLAPFGNRMPLLHFEVTRWVKPLHHAHPIAEDLVRSMVLIPGSGEYVYDTLIQKKHRAFLLGKAM